VDLVVTGEHMIRQIPRLFGPILNKIGKFPIAVNLSGVKNITSYMIEQIVPRLERTVRIKTGKYFNVNVSVGNVLLKPKQLVSRGDFWGDS
jgi:ribosomal protein L1